MPRKGMRSLCFTTSTTTSKTPSYFDHSPSPSSSTLSRSMERSLATAEPLIMKWNPDTTAYARVTSLFYEDKREAMAFIKCVNDLQRNMHLAVAEHYSSEHFIIKAQCLMQIAMKRLQKEFYQILSTNRAHLDPESVSARSSSSARASTRSSTSDYDDDSDEIRIAGDSISEVEQVSILAMDNLRLIAECMASAGYGKECLRIYTIIRKSIIDEGVYRLGVEKMSVNQASKMDWEVQDMKIKNWLEAVKIAMRTLFTGEKILCDHVFASSESMRESCFAEISKDGAVILFGFPEFIVKSKKSRPEKMFRALDMYTAISEQWAEIESIFSSESTSAVRSQALNSLIKLGESVRTMLSDFESALQKDSSKSPVSGGGIHHLTNEVMNYLTNLADYGNVLSDIILSPPEKFELPASYFESSSDSEDGAPAPPLFVHVAWLILVLLCKLDGKSKHHKQDASLSYLFLANNLQYIISKVRRSNLKYILGDEWISKHETKVKQFAANYEQLGWSHVYSSLPINPTAAMTAEEAKEYFKQFNSRFEEARRRQSSCIVPDVKLRDEIRVSIAKKILPVYRDLYHAHRLTVGGERNIRVFVRFAPEDVGNCLSDLFYGNEESVSASSSSPSPSPSPNRGFFRAR